MTEETMERLRDFLPKDRTIRGAKEILHFLDEVPMFLKEGPWVPAMYAVIIWFSAYLLATYPAAAQAYVSHEGALSPEAAANLGWLQWFRLLAGSFGLVVSLGIFYFTGVWPFASYTMISWNLLTLRLLTAFMGYAGVPYLHFISECLRFPALSMCTITMSFWWIILVPLISLLLRNKLRERIFFWRLNLSPVMLSLHCFNVPMAAMDFLFSHKPLTFFDLWMGLVVSLLYCFFYLHVLDPQGVHFYIIFTPRTTLCIVSYALIIGTYVVSYYVWNHAMTLMFA